MKTRHIISNNKAVLFKARQSTTILSLELTLEKMLNRTQVLNSVDKSSNTETDIFELIREDRTSALCMLLEEHMYKKIVSVVSARHAKLDLSVSCFDYGAFPTMLKKTRSRMRVLLLQIAQNNICSALLHRKLLS